ncbi:MAG: YaaR family protein [Treponema sp.]|nr:YaaR family protein [Treponema sp.]
MDGVDSVSSGLYFNATQLAAAENARKANKKEKSGEVKKSAFATAFEKSRMEHQLQMEGFPVEIAGMEVEEAARYLKDAADIAADKLKECQMPDVFADYRKKVSQFMRYVVKNNFTIEQHAVPGRKGRKVQPKTQVVVINQKLDELARWLLKGHSETLLMLKKIDEISGLLVDLMAT